VICLKRHKSIAHRAQAAGETSMSRIVSSGQTWVVSSSVADSGDTVLSGGTEIVAVGGTASGTTISAGGQLNVSGVTIGTILHGAEQVCPGGVANGTAIHSGGIQEIQEAGVARDAMVGSSGGQVIFGGGIASATVIGGGGIQAIVAGAAAGTVVSSGGLLTVTGMPGQNGMVSGATLAGGILDIQPGGTAGSSLIGFTGGGILQLGASVQFAGTVSGFGAGCRIGLADIVFGPGTALRYLDQPGKGSGTLEVSDGDGTATIALLGDYAASEFVLLAGARGGTLVTFRGG
jgi:autotransporter passenger strand-loop-strand repeat protein